MMGAWRYAAMAAAIGGALTVGAGLYVSLDLERSRGEDAAWRATAAAGVSQKLAAVFEGRVSTLVVRRLAGGTPPKAAAEPTALTEFRGAVKRGGRSRSLVGRAGWRCGASFDAAELRRDACWELLSLYVDGVAVAPDGSAAGIVETGADREPAPVGDTVSTRADAPRAGAAPHPAEPGASSRLAAAAIQTSEAGPNGDAVKQAPTGQPAAMAHGSPQVAAAPAPRPAAPSRPAPAAPLRPQATHRISGKKANLRQGPGTRFPSLGLVERDFALSHLRTEGAWSEFTVAEGPLSGRRVWVYAPLTAPLR